MPQKFGDKTTWIKGHLAGPQTPFIYFDLYHCQAIRQENTNDYSLWTDGRVVELVDCVVKDDLEEIKPPAET